MCVCVCVCVCGMYLSMLESMLCAHGVVYSTSNIVPCLLVNGMLVGFCTNKGFKSSYDQLVNRFSGWFSLTYNHWHPF